MTQNKNKLPLPPDWEEQVTSSPEKWESLFNKPYDGQFKEQWWDWGAMTGGFTYKPQTDLH
jgi:hypothetical protein